MKVLSKHYEEVRLMYDMRDDDCDAAHERSILAKRQQIESNLNGHMLFPSFFFFFCKRARKFRNRRT